MKLWKNIIKQLLKTERRVIKMMKCYLKNLENREIFTKVFDSPYLMNKFLNKVKYSKKLQLIGKVRA